MHIAFCVIATGKYDRFVGPLWESARRHFLTGHDVRLFLFADRRPEVPCEFIPTPHRPWPAPTLYRYHTLLAAADRLRMCDYVFYCDADMRFAGPVGEESLGRLTAVLHPGYAGPARHELPYERRPQCRACVRADEGRRYYAGGFQGGRTDRFLAAMAAIREAIDDDLGRGIVAAWHDESHWNRYLIDHPPDVILPPEYCCPESWPLPGRKLLALEKDHAELRSER